MTKISGFFSKPRRQRLLYAGLLAIIANNDARSQSTPSDISDGFVLFMNYCITTHGQSSRAMSELGAGNPLARQLTPDVTSKLQQGAVGGKAWAISSPRREGYLLEFHPAGMCSIRFQEIDQAKALRDLETFIGIIKPKLAPIESKRQEASSAFKTVSHEMRTRTDTYKIVMSDSKDRIAEHKAILTLNYSKNK